MKTVLAAFGVLWLVGRISRRSPNHPANSVPQLLSQVPEVQFRLDATAAGADETAQIQGSMILGEDGGEGE